VQKRVQKALNLLKSPILGKLPEEDVDANNTTRIINPNGDVVSIDNNGGTLRVNHNGRIFNMNQGSTMHFHYNRQ
jgi:hypothetical protein